MSRPLSPDAMEALIRQGDTEGCVSFFAGTSEAERRPLAAKALQWVKEARKGDYETTPNGQMTWVSPCTPEQGQAAKIAALATLPLSNLRSLGWDGIPQEAHALALMSALRPAWAGSWAGMILGMNRRNWDLVWRMVRAGLCPKPSGDDYILGMLVSLPARTSKERPLKKALLEDDALLNDDIWRLFEIEGSGEWCLAARDKYVWPFGRWASALSELSGEGRIPRARLLDASLSALSRDFSQFRAGWFSRFHESLAPTVGERAERAERYLGLLASAIPPTVSFALDALDVLDRAGRLPAADFLARVRPALHAKQKSVVTQVLKMLDRACRREEGIRPGACLAVAAALIHDAPDVQKGVLDFLDRHAEVGDSALRKALREHEGEIAASLRSRFLSLLGGDRATKAVPALPPEPPARGASSRPESERESPSILSLDELLDRFAFVLENPVEIDEVERVLDGVSRLCAVRPADFGTLSGPLRKRALSLAARAVPSERPVQYGMAWLAVAWTTGQLPERFHPKAVDFTEVFLTRLDAIARRVIVGRAFPLLSAPTHRGGWIRPGALPGRVRAWSAGRSKPDVLDAAIALLRLAPDGRPEALKESEGIPGELGDALRFALGAEAAPVGPTVALWIAAARCRAPSEDCPAVAARHPDCGPDAALAARIVSRVEPRRSPSNSSVQWREFRVDVSPPAPRAIPAEHPAVLFHAAANRRFIDVRTEIGADGSIIRWSSTIWPAGREGFFGCGAVHVGNNLDWWEAQWENRAYLEPLLDPRAPLGPMARTLLALGLAAKEPGEHGLSTDALIAAGEDGRLQPEAFGASMAALLPTGIIKAGRWAKTLGECARASLRHAEMIRAVIASALRGDPAKAPADLGKLLGLLHELLNETGERLRDPEARNYLEGVRTGGQTGRLARQILSLGDSPSGSRRV